MNLIHSGLRCRRDNIHPLDFWYELALDQVYEAITCSGGYIVSLDGLKGLILYCQR